MKEDTVEDGVDAALLFVSETSLFTAGRMVDVVISAPLAMPNWLGIKTPPLSKTRWEATQTIVPLDDVGPKMVT